MPALQLWGRKWLAATDDMVFPGLFEFVIRLIGLILVSLVYVRYYASTWECARGGDLVRTYIVGMMVLLSVVLLTLAVLINRSAQGSIMNTRARRHVPAVLVFKVLLIIPEVCWNVMGTIWAFSTDLVQCSPESFTKAVVEVMVLFDWVLFALTVFGLAVVFDPIGSLRRPPHLHNSEPLALESARHRRVAGMWVRRFRLIFCWVRGDDGCSEAFQQVAALLSALFRSTDLVPSDVLAGSVLLRVKQKRETRERRRLDLLGESPSPKRTVEVRELFVDAPAWMCLERARHFLRLSMAAYGWPFVMYQYCATGIFRMIPHMTCCACFRSKSTLVMEDNCCLCNLAGVRYLSQVPPHDIMFASFRNHLFELPFCVIADHKTASIVVAVRGSFSIRDVFTDLTANSEKFNVAGAPPDTMAHKGMLLGAQYIKKRLDDVGILERAFNLYPNYSLILTGHSLGAGVAVLLAMIIKPKYPDVKVYSFATPAGLLSREAARYTESFCFTVGVGDDFVMRLSVDSVENVRTQILEVLEACRLPKYRIILNGCGYALFGVPSRDLESTWRKSQVITSTPRPRAQHGDCSLLAKDIKDRRFSRTRLYTAGRILHITHRKKSKDDRKAGRGGPTYEMRWAPAEDFTELKIEPRMLLDHLPENVYKTIDTVLNEQVQEIGGPILTYRRGIIREV